MNVRIRTQGEGGRESRTGRKTWIASLSVAAAAADLATDV